MNRWSEQQARIFQWFAGEREAQNLVVRARAGTGKTTTIIEAIGHIQAKRYINSIETPSASLRDPATLCQFPRVLVCAFNKRIQTELQTRLAEFPHADAKTLHALGFMFLRAAWGDLTLDGDVEKERINDAIIGKRPQWDVLTALRKLMSYAKGASPFLSANELAELAITLNLDVDDTYQFDALWMGQVVRRAMDASLERDSANRISFDDMIFVPAVNGYAQRLYDWVIVDEAQDMSAAQLIIAKAACKEDGHMVVVGDDRQAIYGFRGADSNCLTRLQEELDADELGLNTTYRCPKTVVAAANSIVKDFFAADTAPEGQVINGSIADVLAKARPGDVILSRTNAPLVPLCLSFIRKQIPAKIEGRDIGKMLADRAKKLKAGTVEEFYEKLVGWAKRANSRAIANGKNVDAKLQQIADVRETLEAIAEDCESMEMFYDRCNKLFADVAEQSSAGCVVLSTVHKAKGLEWERVFLLENTMYCNGRKLEDIEEDNIFYVAMTRTKNALMMVGGSHAAG